MAKHERQMELLEALTELPNISMACKKVGVSRQTFYRWCHDRDFKKMSMTAQRLGETHLDDLAEGALVKKINEGHWQAIKYRLNRKHMKYQAAQPTSHYPNPSNQDDYEDLFNMLDEPREDEDVDSFTS